MIAATATADVWHIQWLYAGSPWCQLCRDWWHRCHQSRQSWHHTNSRSVQINYPSFLREPWGYHMTWRPPFVSSGSDRWRLWVTSDRPAPSDGTSRWDAGESDWGHRLGGHLPGCSLWQRPRHTCSDRPPPPSCPLENVEECNVKICVVKGLQLANVSECLWLCKTENDKHRLLNPVGNYEAQMQVNSVIKIYMAMMILTTTTTMITTTAMTTMMTHRAICQTNVINGVLWHSPKTNCPGNAQNINL